MRIEGSAAYTITRLGADLQKVEAEGLEPVVVSGARAGKNIQMKARRPRVGASEWRISIYNRGDRSPMRAPTKTDSRVNKVADSAVIAVK